MALILLGFTRNFASIITTWGSPTVPIPLSGAQFWTLTRVSEQHSDHLARNLFGMLHGL